MMEGLSVDWPVIGLVLAIELLLSIGLAVLVRLFSRQRLTGQTYWMVVLGVALTVTPSGLVIGWQAVGFLAVCFGLTGLVMAAEYFTRLIEEHQHAQQAREELLK